MYNIKLKFTVIASCGAYVVTLSSKQWNSCDSWEDWKQQLVWRERILSLKAKNPAMTKEGKTPNHHKSTRYPWWASVHFWRALSALPEPGINPWLAGTAPLFRALLFSLVTPRLRERGSQPLPAAAKQQGMEPRVNLFSGLTVLGEKQNCCDGRVTFYFLIDQMARITDLCKPRASFPIWRLLGEIK